MNNGIEKVVVDETKKKKRKHLKITYEEAGYIFPPKDKEKYAPKGKGIRCGTCLFFAGKKYKACKLVDGYIHPQACCNLYSRSVEDLVSDMKYSSGRKLKKRVRKLLSE